MPKNSPSYVTRSDEATNAPLEFLKNENDVLENLQNGEAKKGIEKMSEKMNAINELSTLQLFNKNLSETVALTNAKNASNEVATVEKTVATKSAEEVKAFTALAVLVNVDLEVATTKDLTGKLLRKWYLNELTGFDSASSAKDSSEAKHTIYKNADRRLRLMFAKVESPDKVRLEKATAEKLKLAVMHISYALDITYERAMNELKATTTKERAVTCDGVESEVITAIGETIVSDAEKVSLDRVTKIIS